MIPMYNQGENLWLSNNDKKCFTNSVFPILFIAVQGIPVFIMDSLSQDAPEDAISSQIARLLISTFLLLSRAEPAPVTTYVPVCTICLLFVFPKRLEASCLVCHNIIRTETQGLAQKSKSIKISLMNR
jgi:hypothetical protein